MSAAKSVICSLLSRKRPWRKANFDSSPSLRFRRVPYRVGIVAVSFKYSGKSIIE